MVLKADRNLGFASAGRFSKSIAGGDSASVFQESHRAFLEVIADRLGAQVIAQYIYAA
jgi:hypothetical protein